MSQLEFLKGILPEGTRYSLRLIRKATNTAFNRFFSSVEEMLDPIKDWVSQGYDVYYVTAGLGAGTNATAENAVAKRELYVDIDCGPSKAYETKDQGVSALKEFCKEVGLPRPTIVDSGNGLHAHWVFEQSVAVHEWSQVATAFKSLCKEKNFEVDPVCTADVVRVLRVPETINSKNGSEVTLLTPIKYYQFAALRAVLARVFIPADFSKAKKISKGASSSLTKSLANGDPNRTSKFEIIWMKSVNASGCAQIQNAIQNADKLSEPVWRGVLSIAQQCEDRDWAIHEVSKNHPNYSPEETENKAANTKGPYTCETFQGLETAPLCADCQHSGKITSPIQLGSTIKRAPVQVIEQEFDGIKYVIPPLPWPYVRGARGGVYIQLAKDDKNDKDEFELVYPHDLYVFRRMYEPELGDVVWMRHHLPYDGVREFMVSQKEVGAIDKFRERLNEQGVAVFTPAQLMKLQAYVARSIQELQLTNKAESMHTRFGWTKHSTFIVGNREYTKDGVVNVPVARTLDKYVGWFNLKGSLDKWKKIADAYNRPECDMHAMGLLAGFGSVLMALSPENGGVLHFFSKKSGTGKTTILKMVNSIFGDPRALMKDAQDTHLTKVHRMGILNGIPLCLDEMTNTTPQELSSLLYGCTQGRARDRMESGRNAERLNDLTWKQLSIWSGNTSNEDRLSLIKMNPQGELARLIEVHLETPVPEDVLGSQLLFNSLNENYGVAGHEYMSYVIPNLEHIKIIWDDTRDLIYKYRKWTQVERYKLNQIICITTAGIITNSIGLTNYNIKRITRKAIDLVKAETEAMSMQASKAVETFAAFINQNINNILIIDSIVRVNGLQNEPYMKPKGTLVIRYEPDTKSLFIVQREFTHWCAQNFVNAKEIRTNFIDETGVPLKIVKKRMGTGWDTDFGAVNAFQIDDAARVLGLEGIRIGLEEKTPA